MLPLLQENLVQFIKYYVDPDSVLHTCAELEMKEELMSLKQEKESLEKVHTSLKQIYMKSLSDNANARVQSESNSAVMEKEHLQQSMQQLESRLKSVVHSISGSLCELQGQVSTFEGDKEQLQNFVTANLNSLIGKE